MAPHDAQGIPRPESAPRTCADLPRADLATAIERVAQQLERETFAIACHHAECPDAAYRKGHRDAAAHAAALLRAVLAQHRLHLALLELRASDVDSLFDPGEP